LTSADRLGNTPGQAGAPRRHSVSARDRAQSRPLEIKDDRGAVTSFVEVINQSSEVVMTFKVVNIIAKRSPES